MKKVFLITAIVAFCGSMAFGQFVAPEATVTPALPGNFVHMINHNTTNVASPPACAVKPNGLAFFARVGSTNQILTNEHVRLQFSPDGVTWFSKNVGAANTNITGAYDRIVDIPIHRIGENNVWTNLLTTAQVLGTRFVRVHSLSNAAYLATGSNTLWFTNAYFITW